MLYQLLYKFHLFIYIKKFNLICVYELSHLWTGNYVQIMVTDSLSTFVR